MKQATSPAVVLLLAICTLLLIGANQTANAGSGYYPRDADNGRFIMRFSPVLGINVGLVVTINGQVAGAITKGHAFVQDLPPGRHLIGVTVNGRQYDAVEMILDVQPGQTHSYLAKYNVNQVQLVPAYRVPEHRYRWARFAANGR